MLHGDCLFGLALGDFIGFAGQHAQEFQGAGDEELAGGFGHGLVGVSVSGFFGGGGVGLGRRELGEDFGYDLLDGGFGEGEVFGGGELFVGHGCGLWSRKVDARLRRLLCG